MASILVDEKAIVLDLMGLVLYILRQGIRELCFRSSILENQGGEPCLKEMSLRKKEISI
jgi:hypothetical protein